MLGRSEKLPDVIDSPTGLEAFRDDKLVLAATYWGLIRGGNPAPRRSDLDPGAMPPDILPWIVLIMLEGDRFRYRLTGTGLRDLLGRDLTGLYVDEVTPNTAYNGYISDSLNRVREAGRCMFSETILEIGGEAKRTQRFIAPMSRNGAEIDMIFECQSFETEKKPVTGGNSSLGKGPHMLRAPQSNTISFSHVDEFFLDL